MDIMKRRIISIKKDMLPSSYSKIDVDFIPVKKDETSWVKGMWVMRISVHPGDAGEIYRLDNSINSYELESYFREDGAVLRYSIEEFIKEKVILCTNIHTSLRISRRVEYAEPD